MRTRHGKIARLPRALRLQLNQRLERSEPGPQLLAWLNALPEVQELLQQDFAGEPISKQNLSQWRRGGFQDWLAREDLLAAAQNMEDFDEESAGTPTELIDRVTTVLAARYASLLGRWDGECTPEFESKARVLNNLCRSITHLQEQMHTARKEAFAMARQQEQHEREETKRSRKEMVQPFYDKLSREPLARMFGGGVYGEAVAKLILAVEGGRMDSKDANPNIPEIRALMEKELAEKSQPVKVSQSEKNGGLGIDGQGGKIGKKNANADVEPGC